MKVRRVKLLRPAVPHSRSGKKKRILNGCRTCAPAVPHSRSGKMNILKMVLELLLQQSRTPAVEQSEY